MGMLYDAMGNPTGFEDEADALVVPGELAPLPQPLGNAPVNAFDPAGAGERDQAGFAANVRGSARTNTLGGMIGESATLEALRNPDQALTNGGFQPEQLKNLPTSVRERIRQSTDPETVAKRFEAAQDRTYDAIAYDLSRSRVTPTSVAGTIVGSLASPENFLGFSGMLARLFHKLAGRQVLTQAIDAALGNVLLDPIIQAGRMQSGAQENYSWEQTALAPLVGAVIGGGVAVARNPVGAFREAFPADTPGGPRVTIGEPAPAPKPDDVPAPVRVDPEEATQVATLPPQHQPEPPPKPALAQGDAPPAAIREPAPRAANVEAAPVRPREDLIGTPVEAITEHRVTTADGRTIDVAPVVVEAADLRTSFSPDYDQSLQPRNRDRAASQAQVRDIAANLDPERLGYSAEADRGAPIVGADRMVESGNGRVAAIAQAYQEGGEAALRYRAWIERQGVDLTGFREPVLVRQRMTDLSAADRQAFTVEANRAATLSMGAAERAMADARAVTPDALALIRNPDDLGAIANRDFVRAFMGTLPASERGNLMTAEGGLSAEGLARVRNAVLAAAYGDSPVLARVAEATSDDIKSISNALASAAPQWARLRAEIAAGTVRADMDATPDLLEAVTRTADLRGKGQKLDTFLAQQDAFDRIRAPVEGWMRAFYHGSGRRAASAADIAQRLRFYADEARKVSAESGLDLGLDPVSQSDIQGLAIQKGRDDATATAGLFDSPGAGLREGDAGSGAGGRGSEPVAGGDRAREPGGGSRGAGTADALTAETIKDGQRALSFDDIYQRSVEFQPELGRAAEEIAASIGGVKALVPGAKDRETALAKITRKGYDKTPDAGENGGAHHITDVARVGFAIDTPEQLRAVVDGLAARFRILDEGFALTDLGYGDSKVLVQAPSGIVAEVQIIPRKMADAKKNGGADLYTLWRDLPEGPEKDAAQRRSLEHYADALDDWGKSSSDGTGTPGNRAANRSGDSTRPSAASSEGYGSQDLPLQTNTRPDETLPTATTGLPSSLIKTNAIADTSTPDIEEVLFRRNRQKPTIQLPPDQVAQGRPRVDQGTPAPGEPVRAQRIEDLSRKLTEAFGATAREGRVAPGARGQLSTKTGVVRVKSVRDFDTTAHEVAHALHLNPANKAKLDPVVATNRAELKPLGAGDALGDKEAFAELFRLFITNRPYAEKTYPNATAALDKALRADFPEQAVALDQIRQDLDALNRAPSGEVVSADTMMTPPPTIIDRVKRHFKGDYDPSGRPLYSYFDRVYTHMVDSTHPIYRGVKNLVEMYRAKSGLPNNAVIDILPQNDPYLLARMIAGSHGVADTMLKFGVIKAGEVDPAGPSLAGAIQTAVGKGFSDEGIADFGAYLVARRMVFEYQRFLNGELPNPPGKFSMADYRAAVAEFEAANPTFSAAAEQVYGFLDNHLQRMVDKGLFSQEYADISRTRRDYVPFVRDMEDFVQSEPGQVGGPGGNANLRQSLMKAFRGSDRSVQNPLESIMKRVHDFEFAIARNDTVRALARLAEQIGFGAGSIAERIPSNQMKVMRVDVIDAIRAAGKHAGIDDADLNALILQAEDVLDDSTFTSLFRQEPIKEGGKAIVFYWENGERRALQLADGRFGREMYNAINVMHEFERNIFETALVAVAQHLRAGITTAPDFILANFVKDQQTALVTAGRRYVPFVGALRGLVDSWRGTIDPSKSSPDAIAYSGAGGMSGGVLSEVMERSAFGRNVRALAPLQGGGVLRGALTLYKKTLESSESATRLGLFRSYMKQAETMGFDRYNATLYASFKATDYIDFRRAGASMGTLRRTIPFMNAAIQGLDRETRALSDWAVLETKRLRGQTLSLREIDRLQDARVAWLRMMTFGFVAGGGMAVANIGKGDWDNASKYTRATNFLYDMGGVWGSIPKPYGHIQNITNAFERGVELLYRREPALIAKWAHAAGDSYMPPYLNPLFQVAMDIPANYNRFREKPIVPFYLQGRDPRHQYTPYTSEFAKMIGDATNWSPMKIDYFINNMSGSRGRDLLAAGDFIMGKDLPERRLYDWPGIRRFVKNLARGSEATEAFYGLVGAKTGEYERARESYAGLIRDGEREAASKFLGSMKPDQRVWTVLQTQGFEAAEKRLHPMQNARDQVSLASGMISQLTKNNVIREADIERGNTTLSRRDAKPIDLTAKERADLIEEFQEMQVIAARNGMVLTEAPGSKGLEVRSTAEHMRRIELLAPEVAAEFKARLEAKKVYDLDVVRSRWPEVKRRILTDGEDADLSDLVPASARKARRKKTRRQPVEAEAE